MLWEEITMRQCLLQEHAASVWVLLLHSQSQTRIWMGRHRADFWGTGNAEAPLPNILGARKRPETCPRTLFDFPQLPPTPQP